MSGISVMGAVKTKSPLTHSDAFRYLRSDTITHTLMTIDYAHHEIHSGSHFFVAGYADLAIDHVLQMTLETPDSTKWAHWSWSIETEKETLWQIYEGVTITNALANSMTILNNNRNSSNTSDMTIKYEDHVDLDDANGDISIGAATLLESGISGAGQKGGSEERDRELLLKQNSVYALRATANAAGYINFRMSWYEHTNKS